MIHTIKDSDLAGDAGLPTLILRSQNSCDQTFMNGSWQTHGQRILYNPVLLGERSMILRLSEKAFLQEVLEQ